MPSILWNGPIIGALSLRNVYDGHTIHKSMAQVDKVYGRNISILAGDRDYLDLKKEGDSKAIIPNRLN